ncbi:ABC transporter ATP-binding protein [Corynebacterium frankenforstense]|uniref:ABC transporter ATP-binding protein n=1 Tax=Corynebacterium frankenforstense TaxID=1230998 RepID=UPI00254E35A0|nr:ABC transporter ATP-binding protein [Corynebacterium frankenforstense]MDK6258942.1 ABC transporter ATP-binding protein [Corynebacterium frankenforstense]
MSVVARDFGYRHATRSTPALEHVDLDVADGDRVLLTGDSGAGKSTLLAAVAGVLGGADEGERTGTIDTDGTVGLVLQDPESQVIASRVGDDVAFGCENLGVAPDQIWPRVRRALDLVGLDLPPDHPTSRLSGGQKQRLALAGVIAMGARTLLLDEPTANLDPQGARDVAAAVKRVCAETGAGLIVAEHRTELWAPLATRFLHLAAPKAGGGIREITAAELPGRPELPAARPGRAQAEPVLTGRGLVTRAGAAPDVALPEACSTVITGPNGAGKTSLLLALGGLDRPRRGEVRLRGVEGAPHTWRSAALARRIGTVFQDPEHQFVARSVAEELAVGPRVAGLDDAAADARAEELMDALGLTHLRAANPFTLSGGEKRRLSVATALAAAPQVLLLDEPTYGQDPRTFARLVEMLRELTDKGVTVASVTHDEDFAAALGDHRVTVGAGTGERA